MLPRPIRPGSARRSVTSRLRRWVLGVGRWPDRLEEPWIVGDHSRHAHRLEPPDVLLLVHRPYVELASGSVYRADQRGAHEAPVGHDRVDAALAQGPRRPAREGRPV